MRLVSPQDKAFPERIIRIEMEFTLASDERGATHLRHDRVVITKSRCLDRRHSHGTSDNALNRDLLIQLQLAFCVMNSGPRAHAGAGR